MDFIRFIFLFLIIGCSGDNQVIIYNNNIKISQENQIHKKIKTINKEIMKMFKVKKYPSKLKVYLIYDDFGGYRSSFDSYKDIIYFYYSDQINYSFYAHEFVHYLINNDDQLSYIHNNAILRESIPDIISDRVISDYPVFGCEKVFNRKEYYRVSYSNVEMLHSSFYHLNTKKCCDLSKSLFCMGFNDYIQNNKGSLKEYPKTIEYASGHYIGLPLRNFFREYGSKDLVIDLISQLKKKESINDVLLNLKYSNLKRFNSLYDKYQLEKMPETN